MLTDLTKDMVDSILKYDPSSGELTWIGNTRGRRDGQAAGSYCGGTRYLRTKVLGTKYQNSHLAFLLMTGSWPVNQIDHIDGNKSNNAWENLREVTARENQRNRKLNSNSSTGVCGVTYDGKKFVAAVHSRYDGEYLGRFDTLEEAASARKQAEERLGYHSSHGSRK